MIVSDSDASSENAVDAVLDFSADVLAVDSPTEVDIARSDNCLLYTSPSPRDRQKSRMPSSA